MWQYCPLHTPEHQAPWTLTSAAQFLEEVAVSLISEFVFLQEVPGRAPTPLQPQEEGVPFLSPYLEAEVAQCGTYRGRTCIFSALFLRQPTPPATHKTQKQTLLILEEKFKGPVAEMRESSSQGRWHFRPG